MKKLVLFLFIFLSVSSLISCDDDEMYQTGIVKYLDLEGGFYGIVGDDGKNYDPINFPDGYKIDGLKVGFKFKVSKEQLSIHQWGIIIEITSIRKLE